MIDLPEQVTIFNVARGVMVRAQLVRLTREQAAKQIDGTWWAIGGSKTVRSEEDDHHWIWRKLVGELRLNLAWDAYAIQSAGGNVEGAMTFRIDAMSQLEPKEGVVYVDRLATAPRNRPWLVDPPKYKGMIDFELPSNKAEEWLRQEGYL